MAVPDDERELPQDQLAQHATAFTTTRDAREGSRLDQLDCFADARLEAVDPRGIPVFREPDELRFDVRGKLSVNPNSWHGSTSAATLCDRLRTRAGRRKRGREVRARDLGSASRTRLFERCPRLRALPALRLTEQLFSRDLAQSLHGQNAQGW